MFSDNGNSASTFIDKAVDLLSDKKYNGQTLLDAPGRILYSPARTVKPGPFYLLGLNGGGDPGAEKDTISENLKDLRRKTCHSYVCGWRQDGKKAPDSIQSTFRWLFSTVGYNIEDVCTSNFIFVRSRKDIPKIWDTEDACWEVHKLLLNIVKPSVVLIFHSKAFKRFRHYLSQKCAFPKKPKVTKFLGDWGVNDQGVKRRKAGGQMLEGTVQLEAGCSQQISLFQFPHPSRSNLPPQDLIAAFKEAARKLPYERYKGCIYPRQCAAGHEIGII